MQCANQNLFAMTPSAFSLSRFCLPALAGCGVLAFSPWAQAASWLQEDQLTLRPQASQAVQVLGQARAEGLNPADYSAAALQKAVQQAASQPLGADQAASLDARLHQAVQRYLTDLHNGRVDPRTLKENYKDDHRKDFDASVVLNQALDNGDLGQAWKAATPSFPAYASLRKALHQLQALSGHAAWNSQLPALPKSGRIAAGQEWAGLPVVAQRLAALGDMAAVPAGTPATLTPALREGLKAFQARHSLSANGLLDRKTVDALNIKPEARAEQVALAMERARWTPLARGKRMIVVNVPQFRLYGYEIDQGKVIPKVSMRVIVGKSLDTRTPMFDEDMTYVEFSPYWNVPISIARSETIPRIKRDPGYMARQGFEIVQGNSVSSSPSAANLNAVLNGSARIRQKPGPRNALGDVKFMFPNNMNIYLHHTPSTGLFNRDKRDLSHGCVRVEEPVQLAQFVLQDDPSWTKERISKAMGGSKPTIARLKEPLPVVLTYSTTVVLDGKPHYFADLYGHDKLLAQQLAKRSPATVSSK